MNKNLKSILKGAISFVSVLLVLTLERYIENMYLGSEVTYSFLSHWFYYLIISIVFTWIYWKFESKKIKSKILKLIFPLIVFGLVFFLSNRIELWLNSKTPKTVQNQEYIVHLKGIAWGKIGIEDITTGEIEEIKVKENIIKGISENDIVKLEFKKGLFGFKYNPIIKKE